MTPLTNSCRLSARIKSIAVSISFGMNFILTRHAQDQLAERNIPLPLVQSVLESPEQIVEERGMSVYQSRVEIDGKTHLLRVVTNDRTNPVIIVTVYPTTQINRYWRGDLIPNLRNNTV